ncbi:MAG: ABC-2 transporter permease [Propionibacteriaceae bacterium]|jgi:hypothetical protein|nr:ABC-2 transporter permease [Propionibacteriaceae bacterium]
MIKTLIYKEFRLNVTPWMYAWLLGPLLLFIPQWPFVFAFFYGFFFYMTLTQSDKGNQDLAFAAALPVPKTGIVTARTTTIIITELASLVLGAPVAVARYWLYDGNAAGMNTNLAFFGLMLLMYGVFNVIFVATSYTWAYRMLWPMLGGMVIATLVGGVTTTLVAVLPALAVLNDRGLGHPGYQVVIFTAGVLLYAGLTYVGLRKGQANIARIDI